MLRSIPPANRQRSLSVISSMRAATRSGHVFVGSGSARRAYAESHKPSGVVPDPKVKRQREQIQVSLYQLATQLERLIATAGEPAETVFWQAALARLKGE